jgi:hypothetical protein
MQDQESAATHTSCPCCTHRAYLRRRAVRPPAGCAVWRSAGGLEHGTRTGHRPEAHTGGPETHLSTTTPSRVVTSGRAEVHTPSSGCRYAGIPPAVRSTDGSIILLRQLVWTGRTYVHQDARSRHTRETYISLYCRPAVQHAHQPHRASLTNREQRTCPQVQLV